MKTIPASILIVLFVSLLCFSTVAAAAPEGLIIIDPGCDRMTIYSDVPIVVIIEGQTYDDGYYNFLWDDFSIEPEETLEFTIVIENQHVEEFNITRPICVATPSPYPGPATATPDPYPAPLATNLSKFGAFREFGGFVLWVVLSIAVVAVTIILIVKKVR